MDQELTIGCLGDQQSWFAMTGVLVRPYSKGPHRPEAASVRRDERRAGLVTDNRTARELRRYCLDAARPRIAFLRGRREDVRHANDIVSEICDRACNDAIGLHVSEDDDGLVGEEVRTEESRCAAIRSPGVLPLSEGR
ncbi:MAG: hypothetical protein QOJ71_1797, partial [Actinomycetota bacterium]|nr:hypothetical protein [Actinomycetota bacterium]